MASERFQILALDGGGIKGIFSAAVLAHIEDDLNTRIIDHFDLLTGTSTGGIIALALAKGLRPREILDFYVDLGPKIFSPNIFLKMWAGLRHPFVTKYSSTGLQKSLIECFEDTKLEDADRGLVIPSYNLVDDDVYIFKTPHHPRLRRDLVEPMWKVALATASAPTYFPATREVQSTHLVDGGVWATNPAILGVVEAVGMLNIPLDSIRLFSIGTTLDVQRRPEWLNNSGCLLWALPAIEVFMHAQAQSSTNFSGHLIGIANVLRFNPAVPKNLFKLDRFDKADLMGLASSRSRHEMPRIAELFIDHKAKKPTFYRDGKEMK